MPEPDSIFKQVKEALKEGPQGLARLKKDTGEKILQEFNEKEGDISDNYLSAALQYFTEDYIRSQGYAKSHFYKAIETNKSSIEQKQELKTSLDFVLRAEKDYELSLEISPLTDGFLHRRPRSAVYDEVNERKTKIYLAREFPSCHTIIAPYYFRMLEASKENDFELANNLKNAIKSATSRKDKGIDFQDNLDLEYTGDAD